MASKGPRSKLDHDTRARRQKALEPPREPHRPKTHWDHVLEEMVWLSKDFESERKWKITQAKKVALRASKGMVDQATRGEKRMKEEEQRMRKVALNISKEVKKFWTKIEKLVLYKYQLELDDKKKKALDKQLEYLLGQTERYSNMLAENLLGTTKSSVSAQPSDTDENLCKRLYKNSGHTLDASIKHHVDDQLNEAEVSNDYNIDSEDNEEDDKQTVVDDEALIPEEESKDLKVVHDQVNLPNEKLLKQRSVSEVNGGRSPDNNLFLLKQSHVEADPKDRIDASATNKMESGCSPDTNDCHVRSNGFLHSSDLDTRQTKNFAKGKSSSEDEPIDIDQDDDEFDFSSGEDEDDEATLAEEEELAHAESCLVDEITLLQKESETPIKELLVRYEEDSSTDGPERDSEDEPQPMVWDFSDDQEDSEFVIVSEEDKDDEKTLDEEELAGLLSSSPLDEISLLQKESEVPIEVLLARYKNSTPDVERNLKHDPMDDDFSVDEEDSEFISDAEEDQDDEATLDEEEELAQGEPSSPLDEVALLQKDSEISIEELLVKYKDSFNDGHMDDDNDSSNSSASSESSDHSFYQDLEPEQHVSPRVENDISGDQPSALPLCRESSPPTPVTDLEVGSGRENRIADAAAAARSAQPTGNTFSTTSVRTKLPFLLKYPLREYQHIGLDWLVTMYEKRLNGILADEMGLGKTIMTIALLAHLACEKGIWGPHLIVVPTSVMLNWETEFLKWCPAFKILTYFGSAKERKHKRQGWMKPNSFHVCITTYRLVIQDSKIFKRKKWKYLILDEAHLIKNWKSQRWQTLLNFNSKRRILLTGTPLQNDLMELWSLMHFLMPHVFQSHQEFKDWFCNPISGMVEGQEKVNKEVIDRLHNVLRPFILRRLKRDVESQLPMKLEHVIHCRLSKRQRNLYEDFIASSETQATLASTNFFGMLNVIMQLRKVCNHPDLFEGRPIVSSFDMEGINKQMSSDICSVLSDCPFSRVDIAGLGFIFTHLDFSMTSWEANEIQYIATPSKLIEDRANLSFAKAQGLGFQSCPQAHGTNIFVDIRRAILEERLKEAKDRAAAVAWWNSLRCKKKPIYSTTLRDLVTMKPHLSDIHHHKLTPSSNDYNSNLAKIILSPVERFEMMIDQVESFMFSIPPARAPPPVCWCSKPSSPVIVRPSYEEECSKALLPLLAPLRPAIVRRQLYFPDRRLIQFDCGKLQQLAVLLRRLKSEGHRALIFTQMTKMLDILEAFINLYGYTYMRLDGSTQPEERQTLMQRFNTNPKIFLFILSTRSGGVGINLVGADTVIFYDSDWNPAMDQQAQDRCHRIGQTREVHIYRLISEGTIEENILKKANQKRALDDLVIQSGGYNTEFFKKLDPMELFLGHRNVGVNNNEKQATNEFEDPVSSADLEAALKFAEDEADYMALKRVEQEEALDNQEFTEEAIGRPEDDDMVNEDDTRVDDPADQEAVDTTTNKEYVPTLVGNDPDGKKALVHTCNDDDVDMLADVKQLAAAAAAAGHSSSSFENQLRPIDRYAMRFLENWDPIIDKNAVEYQVKFEEAEWELERLEKLKDDMEAEIDEDEEPLVYESWDADFATEAYRRQVEELAQHQMKLEVEQKVKEKEMEERRNNYSRKETSGGDKFKSKKKSKKVKFKSLKKASMLLAPKSIKEDRIVDSMISDGENSVEVWSSPDTASTDLTLPKKRKSLDIDLDLDSEEEMTLKVKSKKPKRIVVVQCLPSANSNLLRKSNGGIEHSKSNEVGAIDQELKPTLKGKMGGKISICAIPAKRTFMIKPEKLKRKGNIWSGDYFPSPDAWLAQEDAILCALVHEYGPNWSLVSDTLYGMTAGGLYRGRFRHPVHCSERFRELIQKYVLSVGDSLSNEKACNTGSTKALLKVSEENVYTLLGAAMEFQDRELLLQRHFTALLSSVWRMKLCNAQQKSLSIPQNGLSGIRLSKSSANPRSKITALGSLYRVIKPESHKLVSAALINFDSEGRDATPVSKEKEESSHAGEILEVTLEFGGKANQSDVFPSMVTLSIPGRDPPQPPITVQLEGNQFKCSQDAAEIRFRPASDACWADNVSWASSAFSSDSKTRSIAFKSPTPSLGKHKLPSASIETNKISKSKVRKIALDSDENHLISPKPNLPIWPSELTSISNQNSSQLQYLYSEDLSMGFMDGVLPLCSHDEELEIERMGSELVPHCYTPSFISDLEVCPLLPEFTDIG